MNQKVAIILLNWNGWRDTIECLESLYQITYPIFDVIVVDNGSEDESIEKIKKYCEGKIEVESKFFEYDLRNKPIKIIEYMRAEIEGKLGKEKEIVDLPSNKKLILIKNEKNHGFCGGNNIGMEYAMKALNSDYILLLNNDTVVDKEFLTELLKVAESNSKIGIVGSKNYFYGEPNIIQFAGGVIDYSFGEARSIGVGSIDEGQYDEIGEVDFVDGSALLIKKEVVEKAGMLDPDYFTYWDDPDFCVRAYKSGYKTVYVPKARMWHKVSGTSGRVSSLFVYYTTRNKFLFIKKNTLKYQFLKFSFLFFLIRVPLSLGSFLIHRQWHQTKAFIKGIIDGVKWKK
jgi:GT2 family glycosyltransferase